MKVCKSWLMSAIQIALHWRQFSSSFTCGTLAQCRALTSHAAWSRLDANSIFRLTSPQESMRSCTPHLGPLSCIPNNSHLASPAAAPLANYWLKNIVAGTASWSIHGGGTLDLFRRGYCIRPPRHKVRLQAGSSQQANAPFHWALADCQVTTVASYKLEFATNTAWKSKNHQNLSHFSLSTVPTIGTANCTRCLGLYPIRKPG
jgi:hypothetical protein